MVVPALLIVWFGGWPLLGLAGIALLAPMAGYGAEVLHGTKAPPMYARAVARMKFGKYSEAEREIIRELERCEDDFEGWMMLADLYANHFNDLPEAEQTILEICDQPADHAAAALHRPAPAGQLALATGRGPARRPARLADDLRPLARDASRSHGSTPHEPPARLRGGTSRATERGPHSPPRPRRHD